MTGHIPRATVKCISALHSAKEGIALRRTLQTFDAATLFEAFRSEKVERTDEKLCAILERTVSQENEAFAFLYKHDFGGSLNIFGKFAERFFSAEEIMTWQTEDPALIRRRGLMGW